VKNSIFHQSFKQIFPEDINENVFTLAGKIFPVVTVGTVKNKR